MTIELTEMRTRELLGVPVPVVGVVGTPLEYAVFDLAMDAAGATELGKHDWRIAVQEDGKMLPVRVEAEVQLVFCVPTVVMAMTLINIATMPEHPWMQPDKRAKLAAVIVTKTGTSSLRGALS